MGLVTKTRTIRQHRPARVITVSGGSDRALSTIVARFGERSFRLASAEGVLPVRLEQGRLVIPWMLESLIPFIFPARHTVVLVDVAQNADATTSFTIRLYAAWRARDSSPYVLAAMEDVVAAFTAAGVLVDAGPVIEMKGDAWRL